jgi:hypothetical protein
MNPTRSIKYTARHLKEKSSKKKKKWYVNKVFLRENNNSPFSFLNSTGSIATNSHKKPEEDYR